MIEDPKLLIWGALGLALVTAFAIWADPGLAPARIAGTAVLAYVGIGAAWVGAQMPKASLLRKALTGISVLAIGALIAVGLASDM